MSDDKYLVFSCANVTGNEYEPIGSFTALDDAVVIRTHDVFAAPGLYAYAQNIQTIIELTEADEYDEGVWEGLHHVRDYIMDRAAEAERRRANGESKLPTP